jgi:hypothetical protein
MSTQIKLKNDDRKTITTQKASLQIMLTNASLHITLAFGDHDAQHRYGSQ